MFEYLFEKVNKFYEKVFFKYGEFLAKYYVIVIVLSFAINLGLSFGFLKLHMIDDVDEVYLVENSVAKREERHFKKVFNTTDTLENKYYLHQLIGKYALFCYYLIINLDLFVDLGTWSEINFRVANDKDANILRPEYIKEIESILQNIKDNVVFVDKNNRTFGLEQVCAKRHKKCMIDNEDMLHEKFFHFLERESNKKYHKIEKLKRRMHAIVNLSHIKDPEEYINENFDFIPLKYFLGRHFYIIPVDSKVASESTQFAYAKLFKLRISLNSNHDDDVNPNVKAWELELLKYLDKLKHTTKLISFTYGVSFSLDVEMENNIRLDVKFVVFTFLLIIAFSIILMSACSTMVTSPGFILPFSGVLSAVFGLTSAIGLLSLIGYAGCGFIVMVPFLVLGKSHPFIIDV